MALEYVEQAKFEDNQVRLLLLQLIKVFAVKQILSGTEGLFECGYFGKD
jgi:hypothetical protein